MHTKCDEQAKKHTCIDHRFVYTFEPPIFKLQIGAVKGIEYQSNKTGLLNDDR